MDDRQFIEGITFYNLYQWQDGEPFARFIGTYDEATCKRLAWEFSVLGPHYVRSAFFPLRRVEPHP